MTMTDVKIQEGCKGQIIRKHVLRSIQRNNKRVRNAVHVVFSRKMRKEFARAPLKCTHLLFFYFFWGDGVTDVLAEEDKKKNPSFFIFFYFFPSLLWPRPGHTKSCKKSLERILPK